MGAKRGQDSVGRSRKESQSAVALARPEGPKGVTVRRGACQARRAERTKPRASAAPPWVLGAAILDSPERAEEKGCGARKIPLALAGLCAGNAIPRTQASGLGFALSRLWRWHREARAAEPRKRTERNKAIRHESNVRSSANRWVAPFPAQGMHLPVDSREEPKETEGQKRGESARSQSSCVPLAWLGD